MQNPLIAYFVHKQLLTTAQAEQLQAEPASERSIIFYLAAQEWIDEVLLSQALMDFFKRPLCDLSAFSLESLPLAELPCDILYAKGILPFFQTVDTLYIAVVDMQPIPALYPLLARTSGRHIAPILTLPRVLLTHLPKLCQFSSLPMAIPLPESTTTIDVLLREALLQKASDIHIEPDQHHLRIRLRKDGILMTLATYPRDHGPAMIARLKVLSQLDIAERRLPQDGRFQIPSDISDLRFDCRISTCPTLFGEKAAIRILDPRQMQLGLDALGYTPAQKTCFLSALSRPQGLILVTGPTGSGKTVSLYSALHWLNKPSVNIATVEDPVEIYLPGINQVPIHPRIGLTFAVALRAFLRQDPDILMVGEIRDVETAEMSLKAAQTGHLVLSTLHTNSAVDTIVRLQQMEIAPYHIASALTLIIAQRLVRRLCVHCRIVDPLYTAGYRAHEAGCYACQSGYQGRYGIFEMLPITPAIQALIIQKATPAEITAHALTQGFTSLHMAGQSLVDQGMTSMAELHRVLGGAHA